MKAVLLSQSGGPEMLQPAETPMPDLHSDTEVLVRLKAAGINPVDGKIRGDAQKFSMQLPTVLGFDGAGVVERTGGGVANFKPGDEVYFCHPNFGGHEGTYAQYTVVEEHYLAPKPETLSFTEAAAIPLALVTGWEALFDRARLEAGQSILVQGGAGGVGHLAVQLAKQAGAHVLATVSTRDKAELVQQLGADEVILYTDREAARAKLERSPEHGADIVFDTVGGKTFENSFGAVRFGGDVVTLLQPGPEINWGVARQRNLRISMELMLTPSMLDLADAQRAQSRILEQCAPRFDSGELKVVVAKTFPLEQAVEAHRMLEAGGLSGKLVLTID